jgi:hypothetical protein
VCHANRFANGSSCSGELEQTAVPYRLVAPHTVDDVALPGALNVVDDFRPARWLTESVRSFADNVGSLVPDTFAAYARVFHPAHNDRNLVSWAQIARANHKNAHPQMQFTRLIGYPSRYVSGYRNTQPGLFDQAPAVGTLPADAAVSLAHVLARHTATADHCWFAVWHGYGDLDLAFGDRPTFELPQREYHLIRGPLAAAAQSLAVYPFGHRSANLWWPDDHAWCVATGVTCRSLDLRCSYIAVAV